MSTQTQTFEQWADRIEKTMADSGANQPIAVLALIKSFACWDDDTAEERVAILDAILAGGELVSQRSRDSLARTVASFTEERPQDGHVYECCGKVGRISRHEAWCWVMKEEK